MQRIILLIWIIASPGILPGQKSSFTLQDAVHVKSFSISDLTEDGKYITGTIQSRKDRMNIDHERFGDPNYVTPYTGQPVIISTETGETTPMITRSAIVRGLSFSPDGKTVALLIYDGHRFNLHLFDIARKKMKTVKVRSELEIASNSIVEWLPDGKSLLLLFRGTGWSSKADSMFTEATTGPVTVYDSERPFLKWDEIRNFSSLSLFGRVDINTGEITKILPEGSYTGSFISANSDYLSYIQYTPKKTVYDRRGGTEYELLMVDLNECVGLFCGFCGDLFDRVDELLIFGGCSL